MTDAQTAAPGGLQLASFWEQEAPRPRGPQYLAFDVGPATFALPLANVREVDRLPLVTPVPHLPAWVLGVINLRGEILSAVDLGTFFGLGTDKPGREARILACRAGRMEAGLVVETIRDIHEVTDEAIRPPAGPLPGRIARYLRGAYASDGRLNLIVDVRRLLQASEFRRFT